MLQFMKNLRLTTGIVLVALATTASAVPIKTAVSTSVRPAAPLLSIAPEVVELSEHSSLDSDLDDPALDPPDPNLDPDVDEPEDESPPEPDLPEFFIKALNPGYTINGIKESGEFIELVNTTGSPLDLTGVTLIYTNSSGNANPLYTFPDHSSFVGETLVLRYAKSPDSLLADATYKTSLAMSAGPLELVRNGELLDSLCWTGKTDCVSSFKSSQPTTLVRNLTTLEFNHHAIDTYVPDFQIDHSSLRIPELPPQDDPGTSDETVNDSNEATKIPPHCRGLEFSEILTYYETSADEQFVEFYNTTDADIKLDGCAIQYKNKRRELTGTVPAADYFAFYPEDFTFTKNPTKSNTLELLDTDGTKLDELTYLHGQKKATSYAEFGVSGSGEKQWLSTYDPTPGATNSFQEFKTCEAGKILNPTTGNCVKSTLGVTKTLEPCPEGKYRNPLTGRCKNIDDASATPKACAEGYERNPDTGRCRKIKTANQGADYPLVPETYASQKSFIAFGAVGLVVTAGVSYIVWQYRREILCALRKLRERFH